MLSQFGKISKRAAGPMFGLGGVGGATIPWTVGLVSAKAGGLKTGMLVPLSATLLMFGMHGLGVHLGTSTRAPSRRASP